MTLCPSWIFTTGAAKAFSRNVPPRAEHIGDRAGRPDRLQQGRHRREAAPRRIPNHQGKPTAEAQNEKAQPDAIPGLLVPLQRRGHAFAQQARAVPGEPRNCCQAADQEKCKEGPAAGIGERAGRPEDQRGGEHRPRGRLGHGYRQRRLRQLRVFRTT
jgi:hypothetical protein